MIKLIKKIFKIKDKKTLFKKFIDEDIKKNTMLTNNKKVIEILKNKIEYSEVRNENLYIKDIDLTIEAHVSQINQNTIQVIFVFKNKIFDEDIFECVSGSGDNLNSAIENAVDNLLLTTLSGVINALKDKDGVSIKAKYYNKVNEFTLYKSSLTTHVNKKTTDYWEIIKEEVIKRLGNKKVYYLKLYVSKKENSINCECRINGKVNLDISEKIIKYITNCNVEQSVYFEKQSFILIQSNKTYIPYSFNKMDINHIIMRALDLYKKCDSEEKYNNLYTEIFNSCTDNSLTTELFCFIPEIFCEFMFSKVKYSDEIIFLRGNEKIQLFKEQITSYNFIYDIIGRIFKSGDFQDDEIMNIALKSSLFNVINKALNSGNKIENLNMIPVTFYVDENYKVF